MRATKRLNFDHGIAGDAALKDEAALVVRADLAQQVCPCQQTAALRADGFLASVHVGDHRHHAGGIRCNAEEVADRDPRRFAGQCAICLEANAG
jgi:hypothetical protein